MSAIPPQRSATKPSRGAAVFIWQAGGAGAGPSPEAGTSGSRTKQNPLEARGRRSPLLNAHRHLQCRLQSLHHRLQDLNPREALVVTRDERPRRDIRAAVRDHVLDRSLIGGPLLPIPPVLCRDLVLLVSDGLPLLEATQLLLLADVQPEFVHDNPLLAHLLLEFVNLMVSPRPVLHGREAFDAFDQ